MTARRQPPDDCVVVRSPLPPPNAAARRFMPPDPDPYPADAYVQPSEALAKSAALAAAQREAELLEAIRKADAKALGEMPTELNTHIAPPRAPGGNHG